MSFAMDHQMPLMPLITSGPICYRPPIVKVCVCTVQYVALLCSCVFAAQVIDRYWLNFPTSVLLYTQKANIKEQLRWKVWTLLFKVNLVCFFYDNKSLMYSLVSSFKHNMACAAFGCALTSRRSSDLWGICFAVLCSLIHLLLLRHNTAESSWRQQVDMQQEVNHYVAVCLPSL